MPKFNAPEEDITSLDQGLDMRGNTSNRHQNHSLNQRSANTNNKPDNNRHNWVQEPIILQINLNHSFKATEKLKINQPLLKNHVTIIQEPYYLNKKIMGFSITDTIIAYAEKPRTAIVLHKKGFDVHIHRLTRYIIALTLSNQNEKLLLHNIYAPPKDNISTIINQISSNAIPTQKL